MKEITNAITEKINSRQKSLCNISEYFVNRANVIKPLEINISPKNLWEVMSENR